MTKEIKVDRVCVRQHCSYAAVELSTRGMSNYIYLAIFDGESKSEYVAAAMKLANKVAKAFGIKAELFDY